jgi:ornithine carbamoyltransferase
MKPPKLSTPHLLKITDLSTEEIHQLFAFSSWLKKELKQGIYHDFLYRKSLAMIFEKQSTRTRVSFETGMYQLGGSALFLGSNDIQIGRGETIPDTAKVLSRYVDGIMIRTFSQTIINDLASNAQVPVINGLSDSYHPCQSLADYLTISERHDDISSVKLTYIGDGNNVAHSLLLTGAILGSSVAVAAPKGYEPNNNVVKEAQEIAKRTGADISVTDSIEDAVKDAHYLYTDVWTSMGQEEEQRKRMADLSSYKITKKIVTMAASGCKVMHCLPAHRGEEIDADVIDSDHSIVFDQAENRLHIQKGVLCALMSSQED